MIVAVDLEGPLADGDHAKSCFDRIGEVSGRPEYSEVFNMLSRYIAEKVGRGVPGHEYGETLRYAAPFVARHLCDNDLYEIAKGKSRLIDGAQTAVRMLTEDGWKFYLISTSYEHQVNHSGELLGIPKSQRRYTKFPVDRLKGHIRDDFDLDLILRFLPDFESGGVEAVYDKLEKYFADLAKTSYGCILNGGTIRPVGGRRKEAAVLEICEKENKCVGEVVTIADSITDVHMLRRVRDFGGLAIAFNANEYALQNANLGLASTTARSFEVLLGTWPNVWKAVEKGTLTMNKELQEYFSNGHSFTMQDLRDFGKFSEEERIDVVETHKGYRDKVRGSFGKLI